MKYAAFIRGVGPENPNMHGAKLKEFFEKLGYTDVVPVQSSGNVIFTSDIQDRVQVEERIEAHLPKILGFSRATIVRSYDELKRMYGQDPFGGAEDLPTSRLNVTFLKNGKEVFSVIDTVNVGTVKVMASLEKEHGKQITTRTWKTIGRIIKRMEE